MRVDRRLHTLGAVTIVVIGTAGILQLIPSRGFEIQTETENPEEVDVAPSRPEAYATSSHARELARHFEAAVVMLHAKKFEHALVALDQVLALSPGMPEAHTNRGFALLGLKRPERAQQAFKRALELKAEQVNAYYGWAIAADELGDRPAALGAMRTFVHLADPGDPFVRNARAALWEWQSEFSHEQAPNETTTGDTNAVSRRSTERG